MDSDFGTVRLKRLKHETKEEEVEELLASYWSCDMGPSEAR